MGAPQRMCVSCRARHNKNELIRLCKCNDIPVIDNNKEQLSRAIYVCKDMGCIEKLKKNKAIQRVLNVEPDEQLYDELTKYLNKK